MCRSGKDAAAICSGWTGLALVTVLVFATSAEASPDVITTQALRDMSLEELMDIDISTASRKLEKLIEAPAAVYVISNEEIRRSGATSIPEALRLAPGVEVARFSSHGWAVSMRGFNGDLANKLLVLIDGRSVYSPLYAGVFWDVQDTLLEDVDRIEVVAGPGGTLWGANAVNGVINIITRSARDTQGTFFEGGVGGEERSTGLRIGGPVGETGSARAYVKAFKRDDSKMLGDGDAIDRWQMMQGGFRMDWESGGTVTTLQGDIYAGTEQELFDDEFTLGTLPMGQFSDDTDLRGGNLHARWSRDLAPDSSVVIQAYYDRTERNIPSKFDELRDTVDIDVQHRFPLGARHDVLWGAVFRRTSDELNNTLFATFDPDSRSDSTYGAFLQDTIDLWNDRVLLTLGSKFEHNDYTGYEAQPNARLSLRLSETQTLWAAISKAVRVPSRLDSDLRLTVPVPGAPFPLYVTVDGNEHFDAEELVAYELGYRNQLGDSVSFDIATFYNDYDRLQTTEPGAPEIVIQPPVLYVNLPNTFANAMHGETYGVTLASTWQVIDAWRLRAQYSWLDVQLHADEESLDATAEVEEHNSPEHQLAVHSYADLPFGLTLYVGVRYVDDLERQNVDAYTAVDASMTWRVTDKLRLSVTGQNLFDGRHPEFGAAIPIEVERSVLGRITWAP
jgi:iron complex outermembrane receptor protein